MSNYLYRIACFAFRRRRLVLAAWLAAAVAAIVIAQASGGKTNDTFTIPGTESQNAAGRPDHKAAGVQAAGRAVIVFADPRQREGHRPGRRDSESIRQWPRSRR